MHLHAFSFFYMRCSLFIRTSAKYRWFRSFCHFIWKKNNKKKEYIFIIIDSTALQTRSVLRFPFRLEDNSIAIFYPSCFLSLDCFEILLLFCLFLFLIFLPVSSERGLSNCNCVTTRFSIQLIVHRPTCTAA